MVIHQAVCVTDQVVPFIYMDQRVLEIAAVLIILKHRLFFVATRCNVVDGAGVFDAEGSGHAVTIAENEGNVKIKYLTLWFLDYTARVTA